MGGQLWERRLRRECRACQQSRRLSALPQQGKSIATQAALPQEPSQSIAAQAALLPQQTQSIATQAALPQEPSQSIATLVGDPTTVER